VDWRPWRWALRWPREVARARGGLARTIFGVRRGREERNPERMAKRKVEREGEPKLRWVCRTKVASEMLRVVGTDVVVRPSIGGMWGVEKNGIGGKDGVVGAGRWRDQRVSEASLEPARRGMEDEGDVNRREVVVKVATPSGPRREDTPNRSHWRWWSGTT
jgi:hypothetical protein